mmetsp:Transcript_36482/g.56635  ORF Transcript_36482/g.56635 Transcript_36482/m.56635 type:complete len:248 (-) Transcript_36482:186-929(-)
MEIRLRRVRFGFLPQTLENGRANGKEGQLNISHPDTDRRLFLCADRFDDLFKINSRQCAGKTSDSDGHQTDRQGLFAGSIRYLLGIPRLSQDDNCNAHTDYNQANPLLRRVLAIQHHHTDDRRGDQLGLVGDLENGSCQVGKRYVKQGILHKVQQSGNHDLQGIVGSVDNVGLNGLRELAVGGRIFKPTTQQKFSNFGNHDQVVDHVELLSRYARASVSTDKDGARVLQDHARQQDQLELWGVEKLG